jgi:hypothetical protein
MINSLATFAVYMEGYISPSAASDGTNTYRLFFCGVATNSAVAQTIPTNYLGLDRDPATGNVRLISRNAGVETVATGTETITDNTLVPNLFKFTWDGTTATAYKNGTSFATLTAGINTGFTADLYLAWIIKSAGTTARTVDFLVNAGVTPLST